MKIFHWEQEEGIAEGVLREGGYRKLKKHIFSTLFCPFQIYSS